MNDTQILAHPDVEAFVEEVRSRLGDLTDEQREELLDGLAADLTEQLADGADGLLDDPAGYAAELRSAAGLPERRRTLPRLQVPPPQRVEATLDRARAAWLKRVGEGRVGEVVEALRPAWWVARAWVAVTLLDQLTGQGEPVSLLPSLDFPLLGGALLAAAVVVSVLIGLNRLWPGSGPERSLLKRLTLIALNVLAMLAPLSFNMSSPGYFSGTPDEYANYNQGYADATRSGGAKGLRSNGDPVRNIFAYDVEGRPLSGVQLFDQDGRPLQLAARQAERGHAASRAVGCPWRNGTSPQYNVFPLAQRLQVYGTCLWEEGTGRIGPVALPGPPLAAVPPVALPEGVPQPTVTERLPGDQDKEKGERKGS